MYKADQISKMIVSYSSKFEKETKVKKRKFKTFTKQFYVFQLHDIILNYLFLKNRNNQKKLNHLNF